MSNAASSFFGSPDFERGRYGWAKVAQEGGGEELYRRASSMSSHLDDKQGLIDWNAAMVAFGMAKDKSLLANFSVLDWKADKPKVKEMLAKAKDLGGGSAAADLGTAFHTAFEKDALGTPIPDDRLPEGFATAIRNLKLFMKEWGLEIAGTEVRVVNDKHRIAGTADLILKATRDIETPFGKINAGQGFIADLKTGSVSELSGLGMGMQLGIYSHSRVYDVMAGERKPWPVNLAQYVGLILKVDIAAGTIVPWWLNLTDAYANVEWAFKIQEIRKGGRKLIVQAEEPADQRWSETTMTFAEAKAKKAALQAMKDDELSFDEPAKPAPAPEPAEKPAPQPPVPLETVNIEDVAPAPAKTEEDEIREAAAALKNVGEARELYLKWNRKGASADNLKIIANRAADLGATMKG